MQAITVNGVTSAPFRMSTGVAQGDVMSPLLFNLFIESLGRYVHHVAQNTDIGIVSAGVPILDLKYADDVCILCRTPRGVQQAIDAVQRWSDAWGMQLGIGNKKTEAMAFHCPTVQQRVKQGLPVPALPALSAVVGGAHEAIPWVDEYKYLGYLLRPDLNTEGMTAALAANAFNTIFLYMLTRLSPRRRPRTPRRRSWRRWTPSSRRGCCAWRTGRTR